MKQTRSDGGLSLLELEPYTSITDQMRIHLAFALRAPIVGDEVYRKVSGWIGSTVADSSSSLGVAAPFQETDTLRGSTHDGNLHLHCRELRFCTFGGKYDFHVIVCGHNLPANLMFKRGIIFNFAA